MATNRIVPRHARQVTGTAFLVDVETPCTKPGVSPDAWFPTAPPSAAYARRLCVGCPVQAACFVFAKTHTVGGVWGGRFFPYSR